MIHELKTDPEVFEASYGGEKDFEIRKNDRGFKVGDFLMLRETAATGAQMHYGAPLHYTGKFVLQKVGYILEGPCYGLKDGWVIMSVYTLDAGDNG